MLKKRQSGLSLLEVLLALLIIGSIITASVQYFALASRQSKVLQAIHQIEQLTSASYEWLNLQRQADFSGTPNGVAISVDILQQANLINQVTNPWGGKVRLAPASDPLHIAIEFDNIPAKDCHSLEQQLKSANLSAFHSLCQRKSNTFYGTF